MAEALSPEATSEQKKTKTGALTVGLGVAFVFAVGMVCGLIASQKFPHVAERVAERFFVTPAVGPESIAFELAREMNRAVTTGPVAFTVNGEEVSQAEVKLMEAQMRREMKGASDEDLMKAAEKRLVEFVVASQQVHDLSAEQTIALNARISDGERRQRAAAGLELLRSEAKVSEEEIRAVYDAEKANYGEMEYRFRHIALNSKASADQVMKRLKVKGVDFAKVASQYSVDTVTRNKGGLFSWAPLSVFSASFAEVLQKTPVGMVSDPVEVDGHWQIVKVEETRQAQFKSFDEVKAEYDQRLRRKKSSDRFRELVEQAVIK